MQKLELEFHSAEIRDAVLGRQPAQCRQQARNKLGPRLESRSQGKARFWPLDWYEQTGERKYGQNIEGANRLFSPIHVFIERFRAGIIGHVTDRFVRSLAGH
jgi:hypothetical protein